MNDRVDALRACQVLSGFTDVGLGILAAVMKERIYPNATALQKQGEPPRDPGSVVFLVRGRVRCEVRDGEGRVLGLGTLAAGDHLGGLRLLDEGPAALTAVAEGEVAALVLDREGFATMQSRKPQTAVKLLFALATDFGRRMAACREVFSEFAVYAALRENVRGQDTAAYAELGLDLTPTLSPGHGLFKPKS